MSSRFCNDLVAVAFALVISANVSTTKAQQKPLTSDQRQVVDTVSTIFAAARTDEVAKFESVIASDFYMFDGGARFNGEAIMALIKVQHAAGKRYDGWSRPCWKNRQAPGRLSSCTALASPCRKRAMANDIEARIECTEMPELGRRWTRADLTRATGRSRSVFSRLLLSATEQERHRAYATQLPPTTSPAHDSAPFELL